APPESPLPLRGTAPPESPLPLRGTAPPESPLPLRGTAPPESPLPLGEGQGEGATPRRRCCVNRIALVAPGRRLDAPSTSGRYHPRKVPARRAASEADVSSPWPGGLLPVGRAPLAGRDAEMRLLRLLLDLAGGGQTQLALVDGEPGVGKSRLMLELGVEAAGAGWRVLEGAAYEGQGLSPYQPFAEALRRYVDDVGRAAARRQLGAAAGRLLHLLPELRAPGAPPIPEDRPALFEAWAQFARGLARRRPLVVLLDDLHWADPACFELLLYLRRRLRDARLLVVAAYRGAELGADAVLQHILVELHRLRLATALHLARLDESATAGLLAGLFGAPVAPRLAALVHRESEGNPFFVEEIARALAERGGVVPSGPGSELTEAAGGLPISVELREAIRDRLRRLSDEAQAVLRAAAVLGRSVALDDVAALCGAATQVVAAAL